MKLIDNARENQKHKIADVTSGDLLRWRIVIGMVACIFFISGCPQVLADSGPPWANTTLDNLPYTEQEGWKKLDTDVTVTSGTDDFSDGYVEVNITDVTIYDELRLVSGGSLSVSGDAVYWGSNRIGTINNSYDGSNGRLRIDFSAVPPPMTANFETGDLNGWTVNDSYTGVTGQAWVESPADDPDVTINDSDPLIDDHSSVTQSATVQSDIRHERSYALKLTIGGGVSAGHGTAHGPMVTNAGFTAETGDTISLTWYAPGGEWYDVYSFVFKDADNDGNWDDSENYQKLFHDVGSNTGGWITTNATISSDVSGENIRFIFLNGNYDESGGMAIGSNLYIDGIVVYSTNITVANNSIVASIIENIEYNSTNDDPRTMKNYTIGFKESDEGIGFNTAHINITAVNDPPNAPTSPQCEGQTNPTVVNDFTPEFSWTFFDPESGDVQSAYQIIVGTSEGSDDIWNSSKVANTSSSDISYAGSALAPDTAYYWKVKTWDNHDVEGSYCVAQTFTTTGPTLTLGSVDNIIRDWGINFSVNHSVGVTSTTASNVNVTYNVSWITDNSTMGTIGESGMKWHNQTRSNSTVQKIVVKVDATTTTASATNDSETFSINITRRAITITADPIVPQSVNPNTTFWINGSAGGEYTETFIGKAYLMRNGSIIDNNTTTDGNANFSRTEPIESTFNFSIRFYNATHYNNQTTSNATMHIVNTTPPASITSLDNRTEQSRIHWTWTDPTDADFAKVMTYLNGTFKTNVSNDVEHYAATGLAPNTSYTIGMHTVDDKGNVNRTWVNDTARTLPFSPLQRINVTPTTWPLNISESVNFNATGFDHNNDSMDDLAFVWGTTPPGVGTLNNSTGHVVNFTARHVGRTEIYAVNDSVSSSETYKVWITVNALPKIGNVTNGTGNAISGNSTAIVNLNNTSVNGTITIEEIGDPINETEVNGSRTLIGTDTQSIKGVNVTINGSIAAALNDAGSYVHIRIEYNESQLGTIDENTLYIYKFINGTGWLKMVKDENPDYCIANGRDLIANHVWANVTNCSIFMLAGTPTATLPDSNPGDGDGTYPPNWGGGGFALPDATPTATQAAASASNASVVTQTPPAERTTPAPRATERTRTTAPAAGATPTKPKHGLPGFTATFAGCGVLAAVWVAGRLRRSE